MIDCKECQALIDAYLDGELTRDSKAQFTAHISSCDICKEELAFAESVKNTLSTLPGIEVPSDFTERLNARLKAEKKQRPFVRYFVRYGALAACVVLAVVIGSGISETDFSNTFDFSKENITDRSVTPDVQDYAGVTSPTNDETNEPTLIVPRGSENAPESTPAPARSKMADEASDDAEDVTALMEAYSLDKEDNAESSPIMITVSGAGGDFAKELALMAATQEDGVYTMSKEAFDNFISALETVGVEFTQSAEPDGDTVIFEILIK